MSHIVIYGKGKTGQSLLKMLEKLHLSAIMYDDADESLDTSIFTSDSLVVLSPGVPPHAKGLVYARKVGAKIVGELEFCFPYCKGKCISVTGTNGKTTTCQMIYHILTKCGVSARLLGNGGVPLSSQVLDANEKEIVVLESSSFQLMDCDSFAPCVSVFTNVAPDHLNYHGSFDEYCVAKCNNFVHQQSGYALFNVDDKAVVNLSEKCSCHRLYYSLQDSRANCFYCDGKVTLQADGKRVEIVAEFFVTFAKHNISNALAAVLACSVFGVDPNEAVKALQDYVLLPHRLQNVAELSGVTFVDDSKATNVHATVSAMQCFTQNLALILGGSDKGECYDAIFGNLQPNVKMIVAVGETASKIKDCGAKFGVDVTIFDDFYSATRYCFQQIKPIGGVVLMSNACASFDKFANYCERGKYFQKAVQKIQSDEKAY